MRYSSSESLGGILPTLDSSSLSLSSCPAFANSFGLIASMLLVSGELLHVLVVLLPVRLLAPVLLRANHVDDLALGSRLGAVVLVQLDQHESTSLDPNCVSEAFGQLAEGGLAAGRSTREEVVSFRLDDPNDELAVGEGVWRRDGFISRGENVASAHLVWICRCWRVLMSMWKF